MCFRLKARSPLDLVAVTTSGWCATCWRAWGNRSLSLGYVSVSVFLLTHCLSLVCVSVHLPARSLSVSQQVCCDVSLAFHPLSVSGLCQCPSSCLLAICLSVGVIQCLSCCSSTICLSVSPCSFIHISVSLVLLMG